MEEKYNAALAILKKYGQEHLLNGYDKLDENKKTELLNEILTIDFSQIEKLFENINTTIDLKESKIEPIGYIEKAKLNEEEYKKYEEKGIEAIKNNKLAAVTMAGGQGTRLGHKGPKGTFDLGLDSHKSIFEILCDTLKKAHENYGVYTSWYIMTSDENNRDTVEFFEKNNYFDYPKDSVMFFKQGQMPLIDENGKLLMGENRLIKEASDGNGGIFRSMATHGCLADMEKRGVKWLFIGSIDNVLLKMVDPTLIGLAEERNVKIATKSVVKNGPHERVGVICKRDGKVGVIEYSEMPTEMAEALEEDGDLKFGESHIMCNLFSIDILKTLANVTLPYHKAHKKNSYLDENCNLVVPDEPNSYKFEMFIFDSFNYVSDIAILRGTREVDFAPVKNKDGVDSPETARVLYNNYWAKNEE